MLLGISGGLRAGANRNLGRNMGNHFPLFLTCSFPWRNAFLIYLYTTYFKVYGVVSHEIYYIETVIWCNIIANLVYCCSMYAEWESRMVSGTTVIETAGISLVARFRRIRFWCHILLFSVKLYKTRVFNRDWMT